MKSLLPELKSILFGNLILFICFSTLQAQKPVFEWAKGIGGSGNDGGQSISTDAAGNIYVIGSFAGTVDFDPGVGKYNLSSNGGDDIFVKKLDTKGNFQWARAMGGSGNDGGYSLTTDAWGNVYITGNFQGTVDFDPGEGTYDLTSEGEYDIFVQKLDTKGIFQWVKTMGGSISDQGISVTTDAEGNVYVTGYFQGTVDFDPGEGTTELVSAGGSDIFVQKLDPSGKFQWARAMRGSLNNGGQSIATDTGGNVYITGCFQGTVDFDPGEGTSNLTSVSGVDIFVQKLDADGNFIWVKAMGGSGYDYGYSIATNVGGNVYITGNFQGTVDFDPGEGTTELVSAGGPDIFVLKLDANGNFKWARAMGGNSSDCGNSITTNAEGSVYIAGYFYDTADFNPDKDNTYNLTSAGGDIFVQKLDANGNFIWAGAMGGSNPAWGNSVTTDDGGNIYATGYFNGTADFDLGSDTCNLISKGGTDIFVLKFAPCRFEVDSSELNFGYRAGSKKVGISTNDTVIIGTDKDWITTLFEDEVLTVSVDSNISETGRIGHVTLEGCSTETITIIQSDTSGCAATHSTINIEACDSFSIQGGSQTWRASGTYTDIIANATGCDSIITINLTIKKSTGSTTTITSCDSVIWNNKTYASPGTYTKTLANAAGCDSVATLILIDTLDAKVIHMDSYLIANALDMQSYNWIDSVTHSILGSSRLFVPTSNGTYYLYIEHKGCIKLSDYYTIETLGIIENTFEKGISAFPNPTTGNLNLSFEGLQNRLQISVKNIAGKVIQQVSAENTQFVSMDLDGNKGVYFVEIRSEEQFAVVKVVVL